MANELARGLHPIANGLGGWNHDLLIDESRTVLESSGHCLGPVNDGRADGAHAGLRTVEGCSANNCSAVSDGLHTAHSGTDTSIDSAADGPVRLFGSGAHDDLELGQVDLAVAIRVRRRHHLVDHLILEALRVHAQDVRLHLGGRKLATLVRVHFFKCRLQTRVRLVDALAEYSLETSCHAKRLERHIEPRADGLAGRSDDLLVDKGGPVLQSSADSLGAIDHGSANNLGTADGCGQDLLAGLLHDTLGRLGRRLRRGRRGGRRHRGLWLRVLGSHCAMVCRSSVVSTYSPHLR